MDSLDRLLDALDKYRAKRRAVPKPLHPSNRPPTPSAHTAWHAEKARGEADEARAELRDALRGAVAEVVREDFRAGGDLREMLREDLAGLEGARVS